MSSSKIPHGNASQCITCFEFIRQKAHQCQFMQDAIPTKSSQPHLVAPCLRPALPSNAYSCTLPTTYLIGLRQQALNAAASGKLWRTHHMHALHLRTAAHRQESAYSSQCTLGALMYSNARFAGRWHLLQGHWLHTAECWRCPLLLVPAACYPLLGCAVKTAAYGLYHLIAWCLMSCLAGGRHELLQPQLLACQSVAGRSPPVAARSRPGKQSARSP